MGIYPQHNVGLQCYSFLGGPSRHYCALERHFASILVLVPLGVLNGYFIHRSIRLFVADRCAYVAWASNEKRCVNAQLIKL